MHRTAWMLQTGLRSCLPSIPIEPADVPKTAITMLFGLFEFVRMPFGLRNAGQTFQQFMDQVLHGFIYVDDDMLIASSSPEEHK